MLQLVSPWARPNSWFDQLYPPLTPMVGKYWARDWDTPASATRTSASADRTVGASFAMSARSAAGLMASGSGSSDAGPRAATAPGVPIASPSAYMAVRRCVADSSSACRALLSSSRARSTSERVALPTRNRRSAASSCSSACAIR